MKNLSYFNEVLDHPLDKGQSEACFRLENCVVAAGAGSGKTQVLASRFAYLVMECDIKIDQILALTFTKKAANEIYQRVYQILYKFASHNATPDYAKERASAALSEFDKARISTLDHYSGSIVRKGAVSYGIKPDFVSEGDTSFIDTDAIRFVLDHRNAPCISYFSEAGKIQDFATDFFAEVVKKHSSVCCNSDYFSSYLEVQKDEIFSHWFSLSEEVLSTDDLLSTLNLPETTGSTSNTTLAKKRELETLFRQAQNEGLYKLSQKLNKNNISSYYSDNKGSLDKMGTYLFALKNFKAGKVSESFKNFINKIVNSATTLYQMYSYVVDFPYTKDLLSLLDEFTANINEKKKRLGILTFADINELALKILCENKSIRNEEKHAIKKIMIDEFQDNNGKNRDLLYLISEKDNCCFDVSYEHPDLSQVVQNLCEDKLFFVGDEKQSIYRFRGADVSVFNSLEEDLAKTAKGNVRLSMTNNYRSTPILLATFNKFFGDMCQNTTDGLMLFPRTEDMNNENFHAFYNSPATYKDMEISAQDEEYIIKNENLPLHTVVYADSCEKLFTEYFNLSDDVFVKGNDVIAYNMAKKIQELHENGIRYSDIAILDRSRTHRTEVCRWLNLFHIPYQTDTESSVFSDSLINDIYYYLRFHAYPQDAQAFASLLCSPLSGLSLASAELLLSNLYVKDAVFSPFSTKSMEKAKVILSPNEYEKYEATASLYAPEVLSTKSLTKLITYLWHATGYRYESLLDTTVNQCARQFDLIFALAQKCEEDGRTLTWFVDELGVAKNKENSSWSDEESLIDIKEVSYPLEASDSVNILTIHKSKGLEYKYVFINGVLESGQSDKEPAFYFDEKTGLSIRHDSERNFFFQKNKETFDRMSQAEFRRVVYVAITRAEKEVWIMGTAHTKSSLYKQIVSHTDSTTRISTTGYYDMPSFDFDNANSIDDIPETTYYMGEGCPTDLKVLKPVLKDFVNTFACENQSKERKAIKDKFDLLSEGSFEVIKTEQLEQDRFTPSSLEKLHEGQNLSHIEGKAINDFSALSEIVGDKKPYGANDFGTLAHRYLELYVKNGSVSPEELMELQFNLNNENWNTVLDACRIMAQGFFSSDLGKEVLESDFKKTEYPFKMLSDAYGKEKICTGSIDLIYKNKDGKYVIVDYKTDSEMKPDLYREQQDVYKKAVSLLFGVEETAITTKLFFLRFAKAVTL